MSQIKDISTTSTAPAKTDLFVLQQAAGGNDSTKKVAHSNVLKINSLDSYGAIDGSEAILTEDGKTTTGTAIAALASNPTITTKDDDYTILDDDGVSILVVSGAGAAKTITLPTLADNQSRQIKIICTDDTYNWTVDGEGAETIGSLASVVLMENHSLTIIGTSGTWAILELTGSKIEPVSGTGTQIYTKFFTGTTDGTSPDAVPHGIADVDKILSVTENIYDNVTSKYRVSEFYAGASAPASILVSYDATNVEITYGSNYNNQKYRIKLEYIL